MFHYNWSIAEHFALWYKVYRSNRVMVLSPIYFRPCSVVFTEYWLKISLQVVKNEFSVLISFWMWFGCNPLPSCLFLFRRATCTFGSNIAIINYSITLYWSKWEKSYCLYLDSFKDANRSDLVSATITFENARFLAELWIIDSYL